MSITSADTDWAATVHQAQAVLQWAGEWTVPVPKLPVGHWEKQTPAQRNDGARRHETVPGAEGWVTLRPQQPARGRRLTLRVERRVPEVTVKGAEACGASGRPGGQSTARPQGFFLGSLEGFTFYPESMQTKAGFQHQGNVGWWMWPPPWLQGCLYECQTYHIVHLK